MQHDEAESDDDLDEEAVAEEVIYEARIDASTRGYEESVRQVFESQTKKVTDLRQKTKYTLEREFTQAGIFLTQQNNVAVETALESMWKKVEVVFNETLDQILKASKKKYDSALEEHAARTRENVKWLKEVQAKRLARHRRAAVVAARDQNLEYARQIDNTAEEVREKASQQASLAEKEFHREKQQLIQRATELDRELLRTKTKLDQEANTAHNLRTELIMYKKAMDFTKADTKATLQSTRVMSPPMEEELDAEISRIDDLLQLSGYARTKAIDDHRLVQLENANTLRSNTRIAHRQKTCLRAKRLALSVAIFRQAGSPSKRNIHDQSCAHNSILQPASHETHSDDQEDILAISPSGLKSPIPRGFIGVAILPESYHLFKAWILNSRRILQEIEQRLKQAKLDITSVRAGMVEAKTDKVKAEAALGVVNKKYEELRLKHRQTNRKLDETNHSLTKVKEQLREKSIALNAERARDSVMKTPQESTKGRPISHGPAPAPILSPVVTPDETPVITPAMAALMTATAVPKAAEFLKEDEEPKPDIQVPSSEALPPASAEMSSAIMDKNQALPSVSPEMPSGNMDKNQALPSVSADMPTADMNKNEPLPSVSINLLADNIEQNDALLKADPIIVHSRSTLDENVDVEVREKPVESTACSLPENPTLDSEEVKKEETALVVKPSPRTPPESDATLLRPETEPCLPKCNAPPLSINPKTERHIVPSTPTACHSPVSITSEQRVISKAQLDKYFAAAKQCRTEVEMSKRAAARAQADAKHLRTTIRFLEEKLSTAEQKLVERKAQVAEAGKVARDQQQAREAAELKLRQLAFQSGSEKYLLKYDPKFTRLGRTTESEEYYQHGATKMTTPIMEPITGKLVQIGAPVRQAPIFQAAPAMCSPVRSHSMSVINDRGPVSSFHTVAPSPPAGGATSLFRPTLQPPR